MNNKIKKICCEEAEMKRFFKHNKELVDGLKVLMFHLENEENVSAFRTCIHLKGYNFEKLSNSELYSVRIIPKMRKTKERMLLVVVNEIGNEIEIRDINNKHYK